MVCCQLYGVLSGAMESYKVKCFVRDNWHCRSCNNMNNLTCHHIIFRSQGGANDLNNVLTLCNSCHDGVHGKKLLITVIRVMENDCIIRFERVSGWRPS